MHKNMHTCVHKYKYTATAVEQDEDEASAVLEVRAHRSAALPRGWEYYGDLYQGLLVRNK